MSEYDRFRKLDLTEVGTRLDHYNELREVFMEGVEMLKQLNPNYRTDADAERERRLNIAAHEITSRINLLSDFPRGTGYGSWLQMTIDMIGRNTKMLTGGTNGDDTSSEGTGTKGHS